MVSCRGCFAAENQTLLFQASIPVYDVVLLAMRAHRTHEALQYAACGVLKVMAIKGTACLAIAAATIGSRSLCAVLGT